MISPQKIFKRLDASICKTKSKATKMKNNIGEEAWAKYEKIREASEEEFSAAVLEFVLCFDDVSSLRSHLTAAESKMVDELTAAMKESLGLQD